MAIKISLDDLSKEVNEILSEFTSGVSEACEAGVKETANETVKELRHSDPPGSGEYGSWKKYKRGWTKKVSNKKDEKTATIHNKTHYRLTHLLEKGHAKVNGGRTRAFPHIAPAKENAEKALMKNIKKNLDQMK